MEIGMLFQLIVYGLVLSTTIVIAVTEALKKYAWLPSTVASFVLSVVVPTVIFIFYILISGQKITALLIAALIALIFLTWYGSHKGYESAAKLIEKIAGMFGVDVDLPCTGIGTDTTEEEETKTETEDKSDD